jgi:hypothetical protein
MELGLIQTVSRSLIYGPKGCRMVKEQPTIRLGDLAHARSGDKGNTANIGVVARDDTGFAWLRTHLTDAVVADYLSTLEIGTVRRYELPHLRSFNLVIEKALGGGASRSLRLDTQGKALATALLELRLPAPGGDTSGSAAETPT